MLLPSTKSLTVPIAANHRRSSRQFSPHRHNFDRIARYMVLTTPESIIEQASTQKLLDDLIDESVRTSARRPIMLQFDPSSGWIWRRWTGTVFSETWRSCVVNMLYAAIMFWIYRTNPVKIKDHLAGCNVLWGQLLQVTTFTLTFFVNQSYALWRKCSELSRRLQGRLNDIGMFLAPHAARKTPSSPNEPSTYTTASRQLLELVSRYVRLFNLLTYASFTRSHRPILTPRGMRRLVERGLMTAQERQVLVSSAIPATQRHNAVLLWIVRVFIEGRQHGHLVGGAGFENEFLEKIHVTRASYGAIGDELQGRMPLAYAHLVQVLVDVILWTYPVMAYTSGISPVLVILGTGLLTMSYQGLFDLAKQFLDPYDNENYGKGEDPLCVDTLIAETNAGSIRWMNSFEEMPFSAQRIKDGELFEYLLPVRGYSVEELQIQEQEKLLKEQREREERMKKDEDERVRKEDEERAKLFDVALLDPFALNTTGTASAPRGETVNETTVSFKTINSNQAETSQMDLQVVVGVTVKSGQQSMDKARAVHKVTSLESGMPVSFDPQQKPDPKGVRENNSSDKLSADVTLVEDNKQKAEKQIVNGSPIVANGLINGDSRAEDILPEAFVGDPDNDDDKWSQLVGLQDLPRFDEMGPDRKEYRVSQFLVSNKGWDQDVESRKAPLTFDDYNRRAEEIVEAAEEELRETEAILKVAPGSRASPFLLDIKQHLNAQCDQIKLDGITQLRGLPPEDPSDLLVPKEARSFDVSQDDGISQQSETVAPSFVPSDTTELLGPESFSGISQLWGGVPLEDISLKERPNSSISSVGIGNPPETELSVKSATRSLWSEEDVMDGKGKRASEILADETWDDQLAPKAAANFQDSKTQVVSIREASNDELFETGAIMKTPPGAFSLDVPEKEGGPTLKSVNSTLFVPTASILAANVTSLALTTAEDLDALEMDVVEVVNTVVKGSKSVLDEAERLLGPCDEGNQTSEQVDGFKA